MRDLEAEAMRRTSGGVRPGLDVIGALLAELGNPHHALACVHVAGTNGKGSVCALLEGLLLEAGLKTAMYTSPHLRRLNERFRLEGEDVDDESLRDALERALAADACRMACKPESRPATFFELVTASAFLLFAKEGPHVTIVETGMGGSWDATNVLIPLCAAITHVGLDHMSFLGDSIEQIAREKAGIIKRERPLIAGDLPEGAMRVVIERAKALACRVVRASEQVSLGGIRRGGTGCSLLLETTNASYGRVVLPLLGDYQLHNLAVAVALHEEVLGLLGMTPEKQAVAKGLARVRWRGRCELMEGPPPFMLDGAHNETGSSALACELKRRFRGRPIGLICGLLADKDAVGWCRPLRGVPSRCWTVTPRGERALAAEDLAAALRFHGMDARAAPSLQAALEEARAWALREHGVLVLSGSLYLVGEAIELNENE